MPLKKLQVGESVVVDVNAAEKWNHTGIELTEGEEYSMTAAGKWCDASTPHDPDGGASPNAMMKMWEPARRLKKEAWFALIGAVDSRRKTAFLIGKHRPPTIATESGELTCFANDVGFMYWNNSGAIQLTVQRTK